MWFEICLPCAFGIEASRSAMPAHSLGRSVLGCGTLGQVDTLLYLLGGARPPTVAWLSLAPSPIYGER